MAVINAIITVGNGLISVMTQSNSTSSNDNLNKVMEVLKDAMLPHYAEATKRKLSKYEREFLKSLQVAQLKYRLWVVIKIKGSVSHVR